MAYMYISFAFYHCVFYSRLVSTKCTSGGSFSLKELYMGEICVFNSNPGQHSILPFFRQWFWCFISNCWSDFINFITLVTAPYCLLFSLNICNDFFFFNLKIRLCTLWEHIQSIPFNICIMLSGFLIIHSVKEWNNEPNKESMATLELNPLKTFNWKVAYHMTEIVAYFSTIPVVTVWAQMKVRILNACFQNKLVNSHFKNLWNTIFLLLNFLLN